MSRSNIFNSVPRPDVPRSFFNMSFNKKFDCDMGQIIPISCEEVLPSDRYKLGVEAVFRTTPLIAPIFHNVKVKFESFFVPTRLIFDDWEEFITGGIDGKSEVLLPLWDTYYNANKKPDKYSLWDYFGLPINGNSYIPNSTTDPNKETLPIDFYKRCYNLVWNTYYRDENIDSEVSLTNDNILYRRWTKDYFTSALPFQQRGNEVGVGITGTGMAEFLANVPLQYTVLFKNDNSHLPFKQDYSGLDGTGIVLGFDSATNNIFYDIPKYRDSGSDKYIIGSGQAANASMSFPYVPVNGRAFADYRDTGNPIGTYGLNDNVVKVNNVSGFNIASLRDSWQLQKFLEKSAYGGGRYIEQCLAHFGLSVNDSRLQRPEFIGSFKGVIVFDEVVSMAQTTNKPQGTLAGKGVGAMSNKFGSWLCPEHGYILTLMTICPANGYNSQGFDKKLLKRNRYDYYFPTFAHLSEQIIQNQELYAVSSADNAVSKFGYTSAYNEYRTNRNQVCGSLRDTLSIWHLNRIFSNAPALNSDFIKMDGTSESMKRVFAVQNEPAFVCAVNMIQKAVRPLPKFGVPGLVDHF